MAAQINPSAPDTFFKDPSIAYLDGEVERLIGERTRVENELVSAGLRRVKAGLFQLQRENPGLGEIAWTQLEPYLATDEPCEIRLFGFDLDGSTYVDLEEIEAGTQAAQISKALSELLESMDPRMMDSIWGRDSALSVSPDGEITQHKAGRFSFDAWAEGQR